MTSEDTSSVAFLTVANAPHFPGAVALLNSLRLMGHEEPFVLVDAGLTGSQRALLSDRVELVPAPPGVHPVHLAPYAPLLRPAGVQVVLDADVIVCRRLDELVASARDGRWVGFVNDPPNDVRHFAEWQDVLGLERVTRRPYLNAGQFLIPRLMNDRVLRPWIDGQTEVGLAGTRYGRRARLTDPFYFADQDVVNALLSALLSDDELDIRDHRLAPHPPFEGVRPSRGDGTLCEYDDGTAPFFLHHTMAKPWLQATPTTVYSELLPRLLLADDVAVRLQPADVPLRLRDGRLASIDRRRAHALAVTRRTLRRRLGSLGIRTRWEDRRDQDRRGAAQP